MHKERSVAAVEKSGALPTGTAFYAKELSIEPRSVRASKRCD